MLEPTIVFLWLGLEPTKALRERERGKIKRLLWLGLEPTKALKKKKVIAMSLQPTKALTEREEYPNIFWRSQGSNPHPHRWIGLFGERRLSLGQILKWKKENKKVIVIGNWAH